MLQSGRRTFMRKLTSRSRDLGIRSVSKEALLSGKSLRALPTRLATLSNFSRKFSDKESGYHGLKTSEQFEKKQWTAEEEDLTEERLDIDGHPVMQRWETNYMQELARIATSKGGRVLEVGFGMAISATAVQQFEIDEHIIMEANGDVYKRLLEFQKKYPKVTPLGPMLWQDAIAQIPDNSIDGILYDTYPLNKEEQHIHQFEFLKQARRILKPGGILTYCNLTSLGILKNRYPDSWQDLFNETQREHILAAGYLEEEIKPLEVVPVYPPKSCEYYTHSTALAPILIKSNKSAGTRGFSSMPRRNFSSSSRRTEFSSMAAMPKAAEQQQQSHNYKVAPAKQQPKQQEQQEEQQPYADFPKIGMRPAEFALQKNTKVNAWTQWGDLKTIMVGNANHACFPPSTAGFRPTINDPHLADWFDWPEGRKKQAVTDRANEELDNLSRVLQEEGISVVRPGSPDWSKPITTPYFEVANQYCHTCVRDTLITVGNVIVEAPMSRRDRYFENLAFRDVIRHLWDNDENMLWKAAPRPVLGDDSYNDTWWDQQDDERYNKMHEYKFCVTEKDVLFDAADIMRAGKDIFVQVSMTCNRAGIRWLKRELAPHGIRVHTVKFPYDLAPSHLDCTFQLLRPGLVLTNPERPVAEEDAQIFKNNGWKFVDAPQPNNSERPAFSQSSKWLSMNILPLGRNTIVVEEQEINTQNCLKDLGFRVIGVPFRGVYEFGGSLHCATWDISREDSMEDFFPNQ